MEVANYFLFFITCSTGGQSGPVAHRKHKDMQDFSVQLLTGKLITTQFHAPQKFNGNAQSI